VSRVDGVFTRHRRCDAIDAMPHRTVSSEYDAPRRHVWECTPLVSKADEEERYKSLKAAAKLAKNPATFWTFALKNRMSGLGVPRSTRVVSGNDGRGMLRAGPRSIGWCCIRPHV
jgi:hypothetical protein